MKKLAYVLLTGYAITACKPDTNKGISVYKEEIIKTEKEFEAAAKAEGLASAFSRFADSTAVINRGGLVKGKDSIKWFYEKSRSGVHLTWSPDFVDVAASGDLGYTYGHYLYEATDSTGRPIQSRGIFHTVWKRQKDGSWRFVWD